MAERPTTEKTDEATHRQATKDNVRQARNTPAATPPPAPQTPTHTDTPTDTQATPTLTK